MATNRHRTESTEPLSYVEAFHGVRIMSHRNWLFTTVGVFALLGGVLVLLNYTHAKPEKKDSGAPGATKAGKFDGDRAVEYVKAICDLGTRISGSEGMTKQQDLLQKHFEKLGAKVALHKF